MIVGMVIRDGVIMVMVVRNIVVMAVSMMTISLLMRVAVAVPMTVITAKLSVLMAIAMIVTMGDAIVPVAFHRCGDSCKNCRFEHFSGFNFVFDNPILPLFLCVLNLTAKIKSVGKKYHPDL